MFFNSNEVPLPKYRHKKSEFALTSYSKYHSVTLYISAKEPPSLFRRKATGPRYMVEDDNGKSDQSSFASNSCRPKCFAAAHKNDKGEKKHSTTSKKQFI